MCCQLLRVLCALCQAQIGLQLHAQAMSHLAHQFITGIAGVARHFQWVTGRLSGAAVSLVYKSPGLNADPRLCNLQV